MKSSNIIKWFEKIKSIKYLTFSTDKQAIIEVTVCKNADLRY